MSSVQINGWKVGFDKVAHTQLLRTTGLSLSEAKALTDRVLLCEPVRLATASVEEAARLVVALSEIGAMAQVADGANGLG